MNKEQVKKLWEWCGFTFVDYCPSFGNIPETKEGWFYPDGIEHEECPPVTLDTLFRWAVPKLVGFYDVSFGKISKEDTYGCVLRLITMTNGELGLKNYTGKSIDPAEALALAILEVIDGH